jgi:Kef-type K+ transport system membrane component KefB
MPEVSFAGLLIVTVVGFSAPLMLGLFPRLRLPSVVLEIVAGIVIGPSVLGWVEPDVAIEILSVVGLSFLLFLSGLEVELDRFRGDFLQRSLLGLGFSFVLSVVVGVVLERIGLTESSLFVAIVLLATSLGLIVPVLKDAGDSASAFGQLVIGAAALADFAAVILLSLFFSRESTGAGSQLVLLGGFVALVVAIGLALARAGHSHALSAALLRLQDTTAQIRVRGAVVLMIGFVALAQVLGLEVILGAFMAGALLKVIDRDVMMTHPHFSLKLDAIGFGFLIPVFFVTSGVTFDLASLFESVAAAVRIPVFLVGLLVIRGLPALFYKSDIGARRSVAAALLQATSLPFIVAAAGIGTELGAVSEATAAALVAAGLLSVLIFPLVALTVLRGGDRGRAQSDRPQEMVESMRSET